MRIKYLLFIFLLLFAIFVSGCNYYTQVEKIVGVCESNIDCGWVSTNCCPESSGAYWECLNIDKSVIHCAQNVGCREFVSPKPDENCECINNECQVK